ncbi:unnamed protein product [Effrenium voratum]|nr:unnamed protein product [Effrenium voratum]
MCDLFHMSKLLLERPDLVVSCPSAFIDQAVYYYVNTAAEPAARIYAKAFMSGFVNIGGLASLLVELTSQVMFHGSAAGVLIASLVTNPTPVNLDNAIDALMESGKPASPYSLKAFWQWLTGKKKIAYLSLNGQPHQRFRPPMAKLVCVKNDTATSESELPAFVGFNSNGTMVPVTARRLALLLMALA